MNRVPNWRLDRESSGSLWLDALVDDLEYEDRWSFTPWHDHAGRGIEVRWVLPDVDVPRVQSVLAVRITVTEWAIRQQAVEFITWLVLCAIEHLEGHERLERLCLGGRPRFNPHPPGHSGLRCSVAPPPAPEPDALDLLAMRHG